MKHVRAYCEDCAEFGSVKFNLDRGTDPASVGVFMGYVFSHMIETSHTVELYVRKTDDEV